MGELPSIDNLEIRCDDVLLAGPFTGSMKNSLRHNSFFGHFVEFDKLLQKYNLHCILTIVASGIPVYPEWVKYINENKHRYTIQMHGYVHQIPPTYEEAIQRLSVAKRMINDAFGVEVTRWYPPFGREVFPDWGMKVCGELGIKFNTKIYAGDVWKRHYYFHYWNSRDHQSLIRLMKKYGKQQQKTN